MQTREPVSRAPRPRVFAHRGGAGEVAESTESGFRHAIEVGADVLELDVDVTRDGVIVVWHGPKLDNVYVGTRVLKGKRVCRMTWSELSEAFVFDPHDPEARCRARDHRVLRLADFVAVVQRIEAEHGMPGDMPWNIEIKGCARRWKQAFPQLFELLAGQVGQREIVLAALGASAAQQLRDAAEDSRPPVPYGISLALREQLAYRSWFRLNMVVRLLAAFVGAFFAKPTTLKARSVQTPHTAVGERLVREVHEQGGRVDAILTPFFGLSSGVDRKSDAHLEAELERLMMAGVDGIMTDYPARVVPMIRQLREKLQAHQTPSSPEPRGAELAQPRGAEPWGIATLAVALCLLLLQSLLYVKGGLGIEDFLGLARASVESAPFDAWGHTGRLPFAWAYLLVDSAVFVPAYGAFGLSLVAGLRAHAIAPKPSCPAWAVLALPLLVLVAVDGVENTLGLARIDAIAGGAAASIASALGVFILARLQIARELLGKLGWRLLPIVLMLTTLALGLGSRACECGEAGFLDGLACSAHQAKLGLARCVVIVGAVAGAGWLFGADRLWATADLDESSTGARPLLRAAIGSVLLRSRYVIVAITLAGALTAGMDQARDVLYAMATWPFQHGPGHPTDGLFALGSLVSLGALGLATAAFEYTCWLWTRSVCQIAPAGQTAPSPRDADSASLASAFAKHWARLLAFVPTVCFVALHARVLRDGVMAAGDGAIEARPLFTIFAMGLLLIMFGVWLLMRHETDAERFSGGYYSALSWYEWYCVVGLSGTGRDGDVAPKYRVVFGLFRIYGLPLLLAVGMLACRAIDVSPVTWDSREDYVPSMALAVVLFSIALWLCLFGWLSVLEVRQSIPWAGLLVTAVALLGAAGVTDNQIIWSAIEGGPLTRQAAEELSRFAGLRMLAFTAGFAAAVVALYWVGILIARRRIQRPCHPRRRVWPLLLAGGAVFTGSGLLLLFADAHATSRRLAKEAESRPPPERLELQDALGRWLRGLYASNAGVGAQGAARAIPVYFISTEGGGIRAAVWTAFVLERMASDPEFLSRTFSISGVSGGAVGAAAFRACDLAARESRNGLSREDCLKQFARTDLLSPLLSAWMFEDVVARVVPTSACGTPGCGILSRGAWFEQALDKAVPELRRGLVETRGRDGEPHLPYLLLNATWVESGERAIASDLRISHQTFPAAKDQLSIAGAGMPLGSAAHNAARFPYINAIGSVHAPESRCADRTGALADRPDTPVRAATASDGASCPACDEPPRKDSEMDEPCGHLADGGYLDNSGAQGTLDVIRGLDVCLARCGDSAVPSGCEGFTARQCDWFRQSLVPQILMIRNDVSLEGACADSCPFERSHPELAALCPASTRPPPCADGDNSERPTCRSVQKLYVGLAGPALTLLNVSGIRASGSLAQARQKDAVLALRSRLAGAVHGTDALPVCAIDLRPDGKLYPLGWHLSPLVITEMWTASARFLPTREPRACAMPRP